MGSTEESKVLNLVERDPNDINDHLKVEFEDVLAEPNGAHSVDCVWKCAFCCFNCGKNCIYRTMTLLCGWCIALGWGCQFGCLTFTHIWEFTPCLRYLSINCGCMQKFWGMLLQCFLAPLAETCALCFSRIQISLNHITGNE